MIISGIYSGFINPDEKIIIDGDSVINGYISKGCRITFIKTASLIINGTLEEVSFEDAREDNPGAKCLISINGSCAPLPSPTWLNINSNRDTNVTNIQGTVIPIVSPTSIFTTAVPEYEPDEQQENSRIIRLLGTERAFLKFSVYDNLSHRTIIVSFHEHLLQAERYFQRIRRSNPQQAQAINRAFNALDQDPSLKQNYLNLIAALRLPIANSIQQRIIGFISHPLMGREIAAAIEKTMKESLVFTNDAAEANTLQRLAGVHADGSLVFANSFVNNSARYEAYERVLPRFSF